MQRQPIVGALARILAAPWRAALCLEHRRGPLAHWPRRGTRRRTAAASAARACATRRSRRACTGTRARARAGRSSGRPGARAGRRSSSCGTRARPRIDPCRRPPPAAARALAPARWCGSRTGHRAPLPRDLLAPARQGKAFSVIDSSMCLPMWKRSMTRPTRNAICCAPLGGARVRAWPARCVARSASVAASNSARLRARSSASSGLRHTTKRSSGKCSLVSSSKLRSSNNVGWNGPCSPASCAI